MKDKRLNRGEHRYNAKVTEEDVLKMRGLSAQGASSESLAVRYKLNVHHVGKILRGNSWGWLDPKR